MEREDEGIERECERQMERDGEMERKIWSRSLAEAGLW